MSPLLPLPNSKAAQVAAALAELPIWPVTVQAGGLVAMLRKHVRQRAHGLCQAIRLHSQQADLAYIAERLKTDGGTRKLKRLVEQSIPSEYRCPV